MLEYKQLGNTALKPEPTYEPENEIVYIPNQQAPVKNKNLSKSSELSTGVKVKIITRILLVTFLALVMIARFAAVSVANIGLEDAKKAVSKQQTKNYDLESILAGTMQLDTIQDKAMSLGMSFPSSNQIVYMNVIPYNDLVEQNKAYEDNNHKSVESQIVD